MTVGYMLPDEGKFKPFHTMECDICDAKFRTMRTYASYKSRPVRCPDCHGVENPGHDSTEARHEQMERTYKVRTRG